MQADCVDHINPPHISFYGFPPLPLGLVTVRLGLFQPTGTPHENEPLLFLFAHLTKVERHMYIIAS